MHMPEPAYLVADPVPYPVIVCVLAHNEGRRIHACLSSLPVTDPRYSVHVVVNGSTDDTAQIARRFSSKLVVHEWPEGGKSRSWNRFVFDCGLNPGAAWIFVDGDAVIHPGSFDVLVACLSANPAANAVSGMPCNGRNVAFYRAEMKRTHGLFGDLYALSAQFVARMRRSGIRLPTDLVGDDGLIGALAKTDLGGDDCWNDARVIPCEDAGFSCEPINAWSPVSLLLQYRRMRNYGLRHFQNRIVSAIMKRGGPADLPALLAATYPAWLPRLKPRSSFRWWWFDRLALRKMTRDARHCVQVA
ncbi:MAG: hypothetical protein RLZZ08_1954 [Pseudomonadota bacterium]|jgi:glycosyltransferase involved in cell wall biosynthesis